MALISKKFDTLDKYLEAKFSEEANKMILKIDTFRTEYINTRDKHENQLALLNEKLTAN